MEEFRRWLRNSDWTMDCMGGLPAIDLNDICPPKHAVSLPHFCFVMSRALAHAQDLIAGRYAFHGAQTRDEWCFHGTMQPPTTEEGEFVLRVITQPSGELQYQLCLHGGQDPLHFLMQCHLYAGLSNETGVWSMLSTGHESSEEADFQQTVRMNLTIPNGLTVRSLDLLPLKLS